jgi:ketosteroid isomerase-like protein
MSEKNVEIVRSSIETANAGGLEAALEYLHPDVEWLPLLELPETQSFRGHEGIKRLAALFEEAFGEVRIEADQYLDAGDHVVVVGRLRVTGAGSGAVTESHRVWVLTLRDGKIIRQTTFKEKAEALEAIGRSAQNSDAGSSSSDPRRQA